MSIPPEKVMEWLRQGGYPLEYETARKLRIAGFHAEQGRHYADPLDPGTNRETDVVATALLTNDVARVILVVECKVSDKPWVVLTSPTKPDPWSFISRGTLHDFLAARAGLMGGLLPQDKPYGFSVVETMRDTKARDRAHDALNQVVSATLGIMRTEHRHVLLWPVVVTTAELFRLIADRSGSERLDRVPRARIRWHGAQARPEPTTIDIVTRDDLERYAMDMRYTAGEIVDELERAGLTKAM